MREMKRHKKELNRASRTENCYLWNKNSLAEFNGRWNTSRQSKLENIIRKVSNIEHKTKQNPETLWKDGGLSSSGLTYM